MSKVTRDELLAEIVRLKRKIAINELSNASSNYTHVNTVHRWRIAICTLALVGLSVQSRPIAEFDEFNPPDGWFIGWEQGVPSPMIFDTDECSFKFFGNDIVADPTHFVLVSSLPKPKGT